MQAFGPMISRIVQEDKRYLWLVDSGVASEFEGVRTVSSRFAQGLFAYD